MFRILWNGKSAMNANQEKLDAISNNLANIGTSGYKKVDVQFKDLMNETLEKQGYPNSNSEIKGAFTGTGVRTTGWLRNNGQGSLTQTGVDSDIAIDGNGYFKVVTVDGGTAYTRCSVFEVDRNGDLIDSSGNRLVLEYENGFDENTVKLFKGEFSVASDGTVTTVIDGKIEKVASIPVFDVIGSKGFMSVGDNLYKAKEGVTVYRQTNVSLKQGFQENSNVDVAQEMADMIVTQRAFQLGSKAITTADEMWGMVNQLRR